MSSKPKRAWSSDRNSGSVLSPARKTAGTDGKQAPSGQGPRRDADDVDALVGDFLKELDALTNELQHGTPVQTIGRPKDALPPGAAHDPAPLPPHAFRTEESGDHGRERSAPSDIDAELARTLDELEMHRQPGAAGLPSTAIDATAPGEEKAAEAGPAPRSAPGTLESGAFGRPPGAVSERVLFSSAGLAGPERRIWKTVIRAAALIFLAAVVFALYRLLAASPDLKAPPMPPAKPPAVEREADRGGSAAREPPRTAADDGVPESPAAKAAPAAAKPAKTLPPRTPESAATSRRTTARPSSKESSASGAIVPQATRAESPPAARTPAVEPEPPPAAASSAATGETERPPATRGTPTEAQAQPSAKPVPQLAVPVAPDARETAKPGAEPARPEAAAADAAVAPVSAGDATAARSTAPAAAYSYTPPVAISKVAPQYPAPARRSGISGTVEVELEVDEQGKVLRAAAVNGPPLLRAAAEDALKLWRFKPAVRNGANVRAVVRISVVFRR